MQNIDSLIQEAISLPVQTEAAFPPNEAEVDRVMTICNACRYCEGFCAVFPAMTRLLEFGKADIHYLANVCHNCGACLHSCQYASPHEFAVNVPKAMASVRADTYTEFAWPRALGRLYRQAGLTMSLATAAGLVLFLILMLAANGALTNIPLGGNFYAIFPHNLLVAMFGVVFLYAIFALGMGAARFWRLIGSHEGRLEHKPAATAEATIDALSLKYLGGGHGNGCNDEDDRFTLRRRRFHHFTFYGFLCCFIATSVATIYHYFLHYYAPYPLWSVPVVFGTVGGAGLIIGPAGLLWLNFRRDPRHGDAAQKPMDRGFIALLFLISVSGLALLVWRDSSVMALLLAVHLGLVMAFFLTMPYGKFAHGVFRCAALLKNALDKRNTNPA